MSSQSIALIRGTLLWSLVALGVILGFGIVLDGWRGAVAGSIGVVLTDLDLLSLALLSSLLVTQQPGVRAVRVCLMFLISKLPILIAAVFLATRLGTPAVGCFLAGIGLVYSALVHVAIRGAGSRQQDQFS